MWAGVQCHSLETVHGSDMLTCSRALIGVRCVIC